MTTPLDEVQEGEAGGRAFEVGQGSVPPPGIADLLSLEIADLSPPEIDDPSTAGTVDSPNL